MIDRREILLVGFLLIVAAVLRMGWPEIIEFKRDEANLSLVALDMVYKGEFPLLGIASSIGFPNAPFNVYILAIPYLFTTNPVVATQFIGLLNVIAVGFTYVFVKRYTNIWIAFVVALLFAVSPWAVIFSRKIWAQNMLPVFVMAVMIVGVLGFLEKRRWAQFAFTPLLIVIGQIHYGAFVIIPASIWLVWSGRKHITRYAIWGIAVSIILTIPYAAGLNNAGLANPQNLINAVTTSEDGNSTTQLSLEPIRQTGLLLSGDEIHSLAGPTEFQNYLDQSLDIFDLFYVIPIAISFSVIWLIVRTIRQKDERSTIDIACLLAFIFPIGVYSIPWTEFHIHYLIPILPIGFIILGFGLYDLATNIKRTTHITILAGGAISLISIGQVIVFLQLLSFVNTTYTPGGFGTPMTYLSPIRDTIQTISPAQLVGRVGSDAITFENDPTVFSALLYDSQIRFEPDNIEIYRADSDVTLLTTECGDGGAEAFQLRSPSEGCYQIKMREMIRLSESQSYGRFDNGIEIIDYQWQSDCLKLQWTIYNIPDRDYTFAIHAFNDDRNRVTTADQPALSTRAWNIGDVVSQTFCLDAQQAIQHIQVGMYHYEQATETINPVELVETSQQNINGMIVIDT